MRVRIQASKIKGELTPPASKSMMQRALAAAALSKGCTLIKNPCKCDDADAAEGIIKAMGAQINRTENGLEIKTGAYQKPESVMVGESGLSLRMFSPILALHPYPVKVNGRGSILKRPVHNILEGLEKFGISCTNLGNGLLPFRIKGSYQNDTAEIDSSLGSQFVTGLLMALPCRNQDSTLIVKNLKSTPYIDMTLDLLKDFGIEIEHDQYQTFRIKGNQQYQAREYSIESDWSSAAPLLVAAAIGGKISLKQLNANSYQADKAILDALEQCGAKIAWQNQVLSVEKNELNPFELDATHCPDLFPPLVALAAHCNGESRIKGVHRLEHKESNRGVVLHQEFAKIGVPIRIEEDTMIVQGGKVLGGLTHSHNDHRIAMALAITALASPHPIEIGDHDCVAKSYPNFFDDLRKVGGGIAQFYFKSQFV